MFYKKLQLRCLSGSIRRFHKTLLGFAIKELASPKKALNIYTSMLELTIPRENLIDLKGVGWAGKGVVTKRVRWNI